MMLKLKLKWSVNREREREGGGVRGRSIVPREVVCERMLEENFVLISQRKFYFF